MTKTRSPRRSAAEILAARQTEIAKLEERAALEAAKDSPVLSPVLDAIKSQNDSLADTSKLLGNGPQSIKVRALSHELWLDEINAQGRVASISADFAKQSKATLREGLSNLTKMLVDGKKVTKKMVSDLLDSAKSDNSDLADAISEFETAKARRQNATKAKRLPKRASSVEN